MYKCAPQGAMSNELLPEAKQAVFLYKKLE
jgi:hypothetical protein